MKKNITWKHSFPIDGGTFYYGVTISIPVSESNVIKGELKSLLGAAGISCFVSLGGVSVVGEVMEVMLEYSKGNSLDIALCHESCEDYVGQVVDLYYVFDSARHYYDGTGTAIELENYGRDDIKEMLGSAVIEPLYKFYDSLPDHSYGKTCNFTLDDLLKELLVYGFSH